MEASMIVEEHQAQIVLDGTTVGTGEERDLFRVAVQQFQIAADVLGLDDDMRKILSHCQRELTVNFPVEMDDGSVEVFTGYRVQHNSGPGPTKGGVQVNPKLLSQGELQNLTRRYTTEIQPFIGPNQDIPAPDVNTNPQIMAWLMDTYSMNVGYSVPGVVTGKPIVLGGSEGRSEATGRGCVFAIESAAHILDLDLAKARTVVQGFGNAGSVAARLMSELGSSIVAVSDSRGGIYNPGGLDLDAVSAHKARTGSVVGFRDAEGVTNEELLVLPTEILIPAALENQITASNVGEIQARLIAEAANGPTTPEADAMLYDRGVFVIPDILANAGGVTVSYFEWVQALQAFPWTEHEVNERLRRIMNRAFEAVFG